MIARMFNAPGEGSQGHAMGPSCIGSSEAIMLGTLAMKKCQYEDVQAINDLIVQRGIDCPIHVDAPSTGCFTSHQSNAATCHNGQPHPHADYLGAALKELGFIFMSDGRGHGLPLAAFRLSPKQGFEFGRSEIYGDQLIYSPSYESRILAWRSFHKATVVSTLRLRNSGRWNCSDSKSAAECYDYPRTLILPQKERFQYPFE
ncbi:hypothetical protein BDBG_17875 [Blastomyces gilchristii SLH14081]|uniref:Glutamate decarboxylase n=1 Tax=Blastomyces gilchristii (strain SLH14081) TaxID=559298 RepID=A0A179V2L0_BLAGS|nr:uncharacterized protein BDBG_17875 [Blastomyces gilchristii SLH14081]OAT13668.1 hypothetical protein BDBG_17875 [Blastomyces gilchristii SLH14081]